MNLGVDLSSYLEEKEFGAKWTYEGRDTNPFDIFSSLGANRARLRLWLDPYSVEGEPYLGGTCDLRKVTEMGKLANSYGMDVMLDFHYSDFWVDPAKQERPKAWAGHEPRQLEKDVYAYTKETLEYLLKEGIRISSVQVGNEITNGMFYDAGGKLRGEAPYREGYAQLAAYLKAGLKAVKEVLPNAERVLHLENSGNLLVINEWYSKMEEYGVEYETMGLSYYPYWHGTIDNFFHNITVLKRFGKKISIVETAYAFTLEDYVEGATGHLVIGEHNINDFPDLSYPITKAGQQAFVEDLLSRARNLGVHEVYYWEPAYVPAEGAGWASKAAQAYIHHPVEKKTRNEWANQCLFDYKGNPNPALYVFSNLKGESK